MFKLIYNNNLPLQDLVLSGHDHDQCTLSHETHAGTIKEASTKTFGIFKFQIF